MEHNETGDIVMLGQHVKQYNEPQLIRLTDYEVGKKLLVVLRRRWEVDQVVQSALGSV
jgi:hypothetical protein